MNVPMSACVHVCAFACVYVHAAVRNSGERKALEGGKKEEECSEMFTLSLPVALTTPTGVETGAYVTWGNWV